jgi:hypothetical protein
MRQLSDAETIEVVELLGLAAELSRTADSFVSAALERIAGVDSGSAGLGQEAARLAAMLAGTPTVAKLTGGRR